MGLKDQFLGRKLTFSNFVGKVRFARERLKKSQSPNFSDQKATFSKSLFGRNLRNLRHEVKKFDQFSQNLRKSPKIFKHQSAKIQFCRKFDFLENFRARNLTSPRIFDESQKIRSVKNQRKLIFGRKTSHQSPVQMRKINFSFYPEKKCSRNPGASTIWPSGHQTTPPKCPWSLLVNDINRF